MKIQKKITSFDYLPVIMTVDDVKNILRVSKPNAYKIMASDTFPKLALGKRVLVQKEAFLKWLDNPTI